MPNLERELVALRALVSHFTAQMKYATPRRAIVVRQNSDGSLDVRFARGDGKPSDLKEDVRIPAKYGLPSATTKVRAGAECVVQFLDADPKSPMVTSWGDGSLVDEISLGGNGGSTAVVVREGDVISVGSASGAVAITSPKSKLKAG